MKQGSFTNWEQANATRGLAKGLATIKQNHLLPEGRQISKDHQQDILQAAAMEQDYLHTEDKQMSPDHQSNSEAMKQDHLHPRGRKMPQ